MIRIQNLDLRLLAGPAINTVRVTVNYNVVFDQIDRLFFSNGVTYRERIEILGRDGVSFEVLTRRDFPSTGWTMGIGQQSLTRSRTFNVSRGVLDEDTLPGNLFDNDEIRCRVIITANNPPLTTGTSVSTTTVDDILIGDALVFQNNGG